MEDNGENSSARGVQTGLMDELGEVSMAKPTGDRGTRTGGRTVGRGEVEIIAFTALQSLQSYKYAVTIASAFGCVHACVHACDVYVRMHKPRQCV